MNRHLSFSSLFTLLLVSSLLSGVQVLLMRFLAIIDIVMVD